jgi:hypothetical protein
LTLRDRIALRRLLAGRRLADGTVLYWWLEITAAVILYAAYATIQTITQSTPEIALANAELIIETERALGIYHELAIQEAALDWPWLIIASNYFYGALHFGVTGIVLIAMFVAWPSDYRLFRTTLAVTTALALVGYWLFPLMPPRLLDVHGGSYGFVDTMLVFPTLWSWDSVSEVSNEFAAMPSMHAGWSLWCALVLVPRLRALWARSLAVLYPLATLGVIVWTGNHFFLDAVGGAAALAVGYGLAHLWVMRTAPATAEEGAEAASRGAFT